MLVVIVLIPDHCLSINFAYFLQKWIIVASLFALTGVKSNKNLNDFLLEYFLYSE